MRQRRRWLCGWCLRSWPLSGWPVCLTCGWQPEAARTKLRHACWLSIWSGVESARRCFSGKSCETLSQIDSLSLKRSEESGADAASLLSTLLSASSLSLLSRLPSFDGLPIHAEGQHLSRNPPTLQKQVSRHPICGQSSLHSFPF